MSNLLFVSSAPCNNNDHNCCYGNWEGDQCKCWSIQIFGDKCDHICRDDLCNNVGICNNASNPRIVNEQILGKCVCDDPLETSDFCLTPIIIDDDYFENNTTIPNTTNTTNNTNSYQESNANLFTPPGLDDPLYMYIFIPTIIIVILICIIYFRCCRKNKNYSKVSVHTQTHRQLPMTAFMDLSKELADAEHISKKIMNLRSESFSDSIISENSVILPPTLYHSDNEHIIDSD